MRRFWSLAMLGAAFGLLACSGPAYVSAPLSAPGITSYDERLIGAWYRVNAAEPSGERIDVDLLSIRPHPNGFLFAGYSRSFFGQDERSSGAAMVWAQITSYPSKIGGETYYNCRAINFYETTKFISTDEIYIRDQNEINATSRSLFKAHLERGYWIIYPEFTDNQFLTLHYLPSAELSNRGFSHADIDCGDACEFTAFDLSTADLVALISGADPHDLFAESFGTFARITGVTPQL